MLPFKIKTEKTIVLYYKTFKTKKLHLAPIPSELNGDNFGWKIFHNKTDQSESGPVLNSASVKVVQF